MSFFSNLFSGGASELVTSISNGVSKFVTTDKERMQLENEERKAQRDYDLKYKELDLEEKKAVIGDIGNARQRDSQVQNSANSTLLAKNTPSFLSLGTVFFTFVFFFMWAFTDITPSKKEIVIYILGILSGQIGPIYSFYFGSSLGSKEKQAQLDKK